MAPRDVRERFHAGEGSWQTALGTGDDTVLEWVAREPNAVMAEARFEFHLGMLVAIRARTNSPGKDELYVTPKVVTARQGKNVTVLARDCPTHKDEAEAIARGNAAKSLRASD
jgi:hypothetical protein